MPPDYDPVDRLMGLRPSVHEQVVRNVATDVHLPREQAFAASLVRFTGMVGPILLTGLLGASLYVITFCTGILGSLGIVGLVLFVLGMLWSWASYRPFSLFVQTMEREIVNPNWNAEWDTLIEHGQYLQQGRKLLQPPAPVRIEVSNSNGQWRFADLPAPTPKALIWFVRDVLNDYTDGALTERTAMHHGYTRFQWQDLRDKFLELGVVQWRHPNEPRQGLELTDLGKQVLAEIARTPLVEARQ